MSSKEMSHLVPHSRCNWIIDSRILIGAQPIEETLDSILRSGVNIFVNLQEDTPTNRWYEGRLTTQTVYRLPIPSGRASSESSTRDLLNILLHKYYESPNNVFYIHCSGGHGRSGMLGAIMYGKITGVSAGEAIHAIERSRETRLDTSRNFVPTPETNTQVSLIGRMLGVSPAYPLPDRSSKAWLKRVNSERTIHSAPNEVRFYTSKTGCGRTTTGDSNYGILSNFYIHKNKLIYAGKAYPSVEHIFQAMKFVYNGASPASLEYGELIRQANTPNMAFILGNQKTGGGYPWRLKLNTEIEKYLQAGVRIRADWDYVKDSLMCEALCIKFTQDEKSRDFLLSTNNKVLIEHTSRDSYWGNGGNDTGLNRLGVLLMDIREDLRRQLV